MRIHLVSSAGSLALAALLPILAPPTAAADPSRPPVQRQLHESTPQTSGLFGDHAAGLGDLDGDGFDDYGVAAPNYQTPSGLGRVYLFSGRTGALLAKIDDDTGGSNGFGRSMASVGDVTSDGRADVAIGAPDFDGPSGNNSGRVRLYDGATGAVLWTVDGEAAFANLGFAMRAVNDTDADGVLELVIGEPGQPQLAGASTGKLLFVRGDTGATFGFADGVVGGQRLGESIAGRPETGLVFAGTVVGAVWSVPLGLGGAVPTLFLPNPAGVNDEAALDLVNLGTAGSPSWGLAVGWYTADSGGFLNNGRVEVHAAGGAGALFTFAGGKQIEIVGRGVTAVPDVDGDGKEEIAFTSADSTFVTRYRVMNLSGQVLDDLTRDHGNLVVSSLRDVTGDGRGELLTAIDSGVSLEFECTIFALGLAPTSEGIGPSGDFTATFAVDLGPGQGGNGYLQVYGFSGTSPGVPNATPGAPNVPLNPDLFTLMFLQALGSPVVPNALGVLDGQGKATTNFFLPAAAVPPLQGMTLSSTVVAFDAGSNLTAVSGPWAFEFP